MNEELKAIWLSFFNWVMSNGPRPENEVTPPEPPPALPFSHRPKDKYSRFHEATLKERYTQWLELHGLHLFSVIYAGLSILLCVVIVSMLLATVAQLPPFGDEHNPAHNEVVSRYVKHGLHETGSRNIITGINLGYRSFDTFGDSLVLFTAAVSVLMLLGASRRNSRNDAFLPHSDASGKNFLQRGPPALTRHHVFRKDDAILRGAASLSIPVILMMGCVVIINAHLSPGAGFSGGAIISTALILAANAFGFERVHDFFNERTFLITTSTALLFFALSVAYTSFTGANHIDSIIPKGTAGNLFSAGLILPLDICTGLIAAGTLYGFYALFSEGDI